MDKTGRTRKEERGRWKRRNREVKQVRSREGMGSERNKMEEERTGRSRKA